MHFTVRNGLKIPIKGSPKQIIEDGAKISSVAFSGKDLRRMRPRILVQPEQKVALGQPLFCDWNDPELVFTSPVAGIVQQIVLSRRNRFETMKILCDGAQSFPIDVVGDLPEVLQKAGLWTSFTCRPFGNIPGTKAKAKAILVTAMDTNPLAPDPRVITEAARAEFELGLEKIALLTDGPTFICQAPGDPIAETVNEAIHITKFRGKHPTGLPGIHLHQLGLGGQPVWQIGYQDVIAIGHLYLNHQLSPDRVVAVAGPMARNPRLLRTRRGANLTDLLKGEALNGEMTVISGPVISGRPAGFLGHLHVQVCLMPSKPSSLQRPYSRHENRNAPTPMYPTETFENVLPRNILPIPLMRALCVGDWEMAYRLGAADLLEEDVALLSVLCTSGTNYGALLRRALDDVSGFPR
ncbi:MAG: hypothetical protein GY952_17750 [Rhodobacteraceae bacterium]|nr:hypothetical protein [Paracoccaceae bacterium]